jgi:hypothetical protein
MIASKISMHKVADNEKDQEIAMPYQNIEPTGVHCEGFVLANCFGVMLRSSDYFRVTLVEDEKDEKEEVVASI